MKKICEFCLGTGVIQNLEYDKELHQFFDAGVLECNHSNNHGDNPGVSS